MRNLFFVAFVLLAACAEAPSPKIPIPAQPAPSKAADSPPPPPPAKVVAEETLCTVRVDAIGKTYRAKAEAAGKKTDGDALTRDALDRACNAMAKAEGAGCTDPPGFIKVVASVLKVTDGKATHEVVVTVRPVKRSLEGTARAPATSAKFEACKIALANACSGAPAETTCTARGVHCVHTAPSALACSPVRTLASGDFEKSWPLENNIGGSPFDRESDLFAD